jgi:hypothetical protein
MNIVPLQLVISPGDLVPVSSEYNLEFLNRRKALSALVKRKIKNKKSGQEKQRAALNEGTHIMLRCCVLARAGKARKTAKYAPRRNYRCARKAHFCCGMTYNALLETSYFNSLHSRPIDPLRMVRER